eukprot:3393266-Rhodomonas_salina.2
MRVAESMTGGRRTQLPSSATCISSSEDPTANIEAWHRRHPSRCQRSCARGVCVLRATRRVEPEGGWSRQRAESMLCESNERRRKENERRRKVNEGSGGCGACHDRSNERDGGALVPRYVECDKSVGRTRCACRMRGVGGRVAVFKGNTRGVGRLCWCPPRQVE